MAYRCPHYLCEATSVEGLIQQDLSAVISELSPDFEIKGKGIFAVNLSHLLLNPRTDINKTLTQLQREIKYRLCIQEVAIGVSVTKITAWIMARTIRPDGVKFCYPEDEFTTLSFLNCSFSFDHKTVCSHPFSSGRTGANIIIPIMKNGYLSTEET